MKILVTADAHGSRSPLERIIQREEPDTVFFLGDGLRNILTLTSIYSHVGFLFVKGNCDIDSSYPEQRSLELEGLRFFLTHGHREFVKSGLAGLLRQASYADVILFGHTHRQTAVWENGSWLFNPGTLKIGQYLVLLLHAGQLEYRLQTLPAEDIG